MTLSQRRRCRPLGLRHARLLDVLDDDAGHEACGHADDNADERVLLENPATEVADEGGLRRPDKGTDGVHNEETPPGVFHRTQENGEEPARPGDEAGGNDGDGLVALNRVAHPIRGAGPLGIGLEVILAGVEATDKVRDVVADNGVGPGGQENTPDPGPTRGAGPGGGNVDNGFAGQEGEDAVADDEHPEDGIEQRRVQEQLDESL